MKYKATFTLARPDGSFNTESLLFASMQDALDALAYMHRQVISKNVGFYTKLVIQVEADDNQGG